MTEKIGDENINDNNLSSENKNDSKKVNPNNEHSDTNNVNDNVVENSTSKFQEFFSEKVETDKPKLTDTLITFLELKNIDQELAEIEDEKGDLPEIIEEMETKISFLTSDLERKKLSVSQLEEQKASTENDNKAHEAKINKYDEQKFNVRSNKEYDEIVKAIDALFEEVEKNEIKLREVNENIVTLHSEIETQSNKINELQTELDEKKGLLNELNEQYRQEESILKEKRANLKSKLDSYSSSLYERINSTYRGEATAIVRKGNCSGCYNSIPPQRVIEIKAAEKIFTCQSCGRILVAEEILTG